MNNKNPKEEYNMSKYTDEIKAKCVEMIRNGSSVSDVTKALGPNPKAIERYCVKAGVAIAKKVRAPKDPNAPKKEKKAKAAKTKVTEDEILED